jgi:hypothetical protein
MSQDTQTERKGRRERIARAISTTNLDMAIDWILVLQDDIAELKRELAEAKEP